MKGANHFVRLGRCGHVIAQCRCPGPKSTERSNELCHECQRAATVDAATPAPVREPRTVCVDLDGVLNLYSGWEGAHRFAPPRPGAVDFMEHLTRDYRVVVLTTRDVRDVERWLVQNGIRFSEVTNEKPPAHVYLDDRAICFTGSFDGLLGDIATFQTHWEKAAVAVVS